MVSYARVDGVIRKRVLARLCLHCRPGYHLCCMRSTGHRSFGVLYALCLIPAIISGQDSVRTQMIAARVTLDSVVIVATRQGFSVEDFIRLVQTDESLHTAFRNLRRASYAFDTYMTFYDRRDAVKATWQSKNRQVHDGHCRTLEVLDESWTGDFYKGRKQKQRYYTTTLYERVFATPGRVCPDTNTDTPTPSTSDPVIERHIGELRKLIFRPGERSNVPLIGRKSEIFSDEMIDRYDFTIVSDLYDDKPVYIFTARVNDRYASRENKTVFKELTTYFHKEDFQVVARTYRLSQSTTAYQFDVSMQVDLIRLDDRYFPSRVQYDGVWNIPTKKREDGMFDIRFYNFQ